MKIEIKCSEDIEKISNLMHDAVFSRKDFEYNREKEAFFLNGVRFMWERAERKGLFRILKAPWIKCRLELRSVLKCDFDEYEKFNVYELSSIEVDQKQKLVIYTAVGLEIVLIVKEIKGYFQDMGDPIEDRLMQKMIRESVKKGVKSIFNLER